MKGRNTNSEILDSLHYLHWRLTKSRAYTGMYRRLNQLREEGKLARQPWQDLLVGRLRRFLTFVMDHVPYYRNTFERVGFDPYTAVHPHDLERVPILTNDHIRQNLNNLISETADRSSMFANSTGGSTGVPLDFYQDR